MNQNALVIKEVNNVDKYIEKIEELLSNSKKLELMSKKAQETSLKFDMDSNIDRYIEYFKNVKKQKVTLTDEEQKYAKRWIVTEESIFEDKENEKNVEVKAENKVVSKKRKIYYAMLKPFPKTLKVKVKNFLKKLIQD